MQPFKLKAASLETEISAWDANTSQWTKHKLKNPRLVQSPPQTLSQAQKEFLEEYKALLIQHMKLRTRLRSIKERLDAMRGN